MIVLSLVLETAKVFFNWIYGFVETINPNVFKSSGWYLVDYIKFKVWFCYANISFILQMPSVIKRAHSHEQVKDSLYLSNHVDQRWIRTAATSRMERFVIIVIGFQSLTIITKRSIWDAAAVLDSPLLIAFFWLN